MKREIRGRIANQRITFKRIRIVSFFMLNLLFSICRGLTCCPGASIITDNCGHGFLFRAVSHVKFWAVTISAGYRPCTSNAHYCVLGQVFAHVTRDAIVTDTVLACFHDETFCFQEFWGSVNFCLLTL